MLEQGLSVAMVECFYEYNPNKFYGSVFYRDENHTEIVECESYEDWKQYVDNVNNDVLGTMDDLAEEYGLVPAY